MSQDNLIQFPRTVIQKGKEFPVLEANGIPKSLAQAQKYAGKSGYVFTSSDLVEARINVYNSLQAPEVLQHPLWSNWHTVLTEEVGVGKNIVIFHGGYVFNTPKRIRKALDEGLDEGGAGRYTAEEKRLIEIGLKKGLIPEADIRILPYGDFAKLSKAQILDLSRQYGVSMTLQEAQQLKSERLPLKALGKSPLFIVRSGGIDQSKEHIEVLDKLGAKTFGNGYNFTDGAGRLLCVSGGFISGFYGDCHLVDSARFVGVNQSAEGASQKIAIIRQDLEERLQILNAKGITTTEKLTKVLQIYDGVKQILATSIF